MLDVKVTITPDNVGATLESFLTDFLPEAMQNIHRGAAFKILETMTAWSRVSEGEMRAGWFSYMAAYSHPYFRSLSAITGKDDTTQLGTGQGSYSEAFLYSTVLNNVRYVGDVEEQRGIFDVEGKESYLPALYPNILASVSRFEDLYAYCWNIGLTDISTAWDQGNKDGNFDITLITTDFGLPTNSEEAN